MTAESIRVIPASAGFHQELKAELSAHLPDAQREAFLLLGGAHFLECLAAVHGERAVGRAVLPLAKLEAGVQRIRALGLHCVRSRNDFISRGDVVEGTSHRGSMVPRGTPGADFGLLYYGVDAELVEGTEQVEFQGAHALLGRLFGYPECCCRFYTEGNPLRADRTADTISDLGPFPREMNPLKSGLYGLRLLSHFPCSPRCGPSRELLGRHRSYLARFAPESMAAFDSLGAGVALYGPQVGLALVTGFRRLAEHTYEVQEVITRGDHARKLFSSSGPLVLHLHSAHVFELGSRRFEDEEGFGAWFE